MPRKKEVNADIIKKTDELLVLKAKRPMDEGELKLLSEMVRHEEEKSGVKVILLPYSVDLVDLPTLEKAGELVGVPGIVVLPEGSYVLTEEQLKALQSTNENPPDPEKEGQKGEGEKVNPPDPDQGKEDK